MMEFLSANWKEFTTIGVGLIALIVYVLQELGKKSDAASLITMQVDDLKNRIVEIQSYIVEGTLNDGAFYESQILFKTDYWNQYKHYFIKSMDAQSFNTFEKFYSCASAILEQQELMKNLQKNFFFVTQQVVVNLESQYIMCDLNSCRQNAVDVNNLLNGMEKTLPKELTAEQNEAIMNLFKPFFTSNPNFNREIFWKVYNEHRSEIIGIINTKGLTRYTPEQIRISIAGALSKAAFIEIIGCDGYKKMKRIAKNRLYGLWY